MLVFTNGCFDVIHAGHVDLLERARALGDRLIVGINSDRSVRAIKGPRRPVNSEDARRAVLLGLRAVDDVIIFDEPTPAALIQSLRPNVLVKGGDWRKDEIIGADLVSGYGGQVHSLPLKDGFSSSDIIERLQPSTTNEHNRRGDVTDKSIDEHVHVIESVKRECTDSITESYRLILETVQKKGKLLICGNGGSAADAQHLAAEFVGRYETERTAIAAIALTTDTSALTAIGNDYGFERVFARQVEALARPDDCLIALSTSGNSSNVIAAVMEARKHGCKVVGMTGRRGKKLASLSDVCVLVPSERTARVQEAHITIAHIWCEMIDEAAAQSS
jgi:D-sedoheptulose 7-phosphate isomerase